MNTFRAIAAISLAALLCGSLTAAEDRLGDPLPEGAVQRLGTTRLRYGGVGDINWMPDGRGLIALGANVEIWDFAVGRRLSTRRVSKGSVRSVEARSDGKALLIADSAGNVIEWGLDEEKALRSFPTGQVGLAVAHYSPDETRVLTTGTRPPTIKESDLASGEELVSIEGNMHYYREAIYGPGGTTCYVNGSNGSGPVLAHYGLSDGELLKEWLKDYYAHSRSLVLSPDGERVLIGSRHSATEWFVDGYELQRKFTGHHGHAVTSVDYCSEPDQLLTGSRDGSIRRWQRLEGKILLRWWPHEGHVTRIRVSPDGKWVLSYGSGRVAVSDIDTGASRVQWDRHAGLVQAVAALPDGRVASGATDATVRIWDPESGETKVTIEVGGYGVFALAASPDGTRLAAGCKDGTIREFSLPDGGTLRELKGHLGYVRSLTYMPDGSRLLSSAGDGTIRVWPLEGDGPEKILKGHRGGVLSVAVSPDGSRVLSGGRDGTVRLWDLVDGSLLATMEGARGWVEAVCFGPGQTGFSAGRDGRLLKWDLSEGKLVAETHLRKPGLVALAMANGKVGFCDTESLQQTHILSGHSAGLTALSVSASGSEIISASRDTTLLVWQTPAENG